MAIRNPRLPLLPGYGSNPLIGKKNFGVRPVFTSIDKVNMLVDKTETVNRVPSLYGRKQAPDLPTWIMYDKHVSLAKDQADRKGSGRRLFEPLGAGCDPKVEAGTRVPPPKDDNSIGIICADVEIDLVLSKETSDTHTKQRKIRLPRPCSNKWCGGPRPVPYKVADGGPA
ncbi:hypothetical protein evm_005965 [Chilo suppressalis]|nr:hypothetical protein evm_005965 [Chilo suppressalis]